MLVRTRARGIIGFGDDGQAALEEAVETLGGWRDVASVHYRGGTATMRLRRVSDAVVWVRAIDRERLLRRPGVVQVLESLARLLVQDALRLEAVDDR